MSRSLSLLRRGLLGIAFVGSLGFGATQAFATSDEPTRFQGCMMTSYAYIPNDPDTCSNCPDGGYCDGMNTDCVCFEW